MGRSLTIPPRYNLSVDLLDRHLDAGNAERAAVLSQGRSWSYGEIAALVNRAGNGLKALGVDREQRVLLVLPDGPELVAAYLGALRIGAVAVPCNSWLGAHDYAYFLRESRAKVLVTTRELLDKLRAGIAQAPDLRAVVVVGGAEATAEIAWDPWIAAASSALSPADTSRDDPAFWLWTSGSTGEPKAAVHLHQDWPWCCELYAQNVLGMTEADRPFSASKLFHAYGLGNALVFPFWVGATTTLLAERPTPGAVFRTIQTVRPTLFFGVPTLYAAMLAVKGAEQEYDLTCVRCCVSAGEPLPAELYRRWRAKWGTEILDGIGSTEVLHIYISARPGCVVPGSSGRPVEGYDVRVVNDRGEGVPPGEIGDLIVKGPSTATSYWNRATETRQRMRGEWFLSGDKYTYDEDGNFWYEGRTDDMFKVGGEWISPIELENTLIEHEAVLECAVVPYDAGEGLLKPKAFVVLKESYPPAPELVDELQRFVRARLSSYKYPRLVEFLPELPKTAAGKIQRFKLRAL
jgi:benzoate-CoA ligase